MALKRKRQFEPGGLKSLIVLCSLLLVLVFAGIEATHAHADGKISGQSGSCAVCVTVHASAPAVTFHPLPALRAVAMVAIPALEQGKSHGAELSLFIRPPPLP
ncbi:MAG TPA: hypothetical protein VI424_03950 [Terriglobales bacterium]